MNNRHYILRGMVALAVVVSIASCSKKDQLVSAPSEGKALLTPGKYEDGIILINEGWFGHDNGNVNFYKYGRDTIEQMVYQLENPGNQLGVTTQSGAVWDGKLYIMAKQGPLVVTDSKTLVETGRIATLPADGRAFLGLTSTTGLISTLDGVYNLNLSPLSVGSKLSGISGETGTMRKEGNYIFILSHSEGLIILNATTKAIVKKIAGLQQGLCKTSDGSLWIAGGSTLARLNVTTLDTTRITMPFSLGNPWFAWNEGTVTCSTIDTAVYLARTNSWGAGGNRLYKYIPGNLASLSTPLATLPANQEFYGAGVRYDPSQHNLVVTAVQSGYGQNYKYNKLYFYSTNGSLTKTISYEYFYFPALPVFN